MRVAGVDGTKGGWVAITLEHGRLTSDHVLELETTFDELGNVVVIAIDVPIGFGPREADAAVRNGARSESYATRAASNFLRQWPLQK
jgi:hypothetical protein